MPRARRSAATDAGNGKQQSENPFVWMGERPLFTEHQMMLIHKELKVGPTDTSSHQAVADLAQRLHAQRSDACASAIEAKCAELREQGDGKNVEVNHEEMRRGWKTCVAYRDGRAIKAWLANRRDLYEQSQISDVDGYGLLLTQLRCATRLGAFGAGFCAGTLALRGVQEANEKLGFKEFHAAVKAKHPAFESEAAFERLLLWFALIKRAWPLELVLAVAIRAGCYFGLKLAVSILLRGFLTSAQGDEVVRPCGHL